MLKWIIILSGIAMPLILNQKSEESEKRIQIALLLDTSNSMDGLIDQAKAQLWKMVNELSGAKHDGDEANIELALYEYGKSSLSLLNGYVRQIHPFTTDLDAISASLFSLHTNGGDEYCGTVIQKSLEGLAWDDHTDGLRMIFIAGNEPFTQGNFSYHKACANARRKDVTVNTVFCGPYREGVRGEWKMGAELGEGDYFNIDHNDRIVYIKTPFDERIRILNIRLNDTYIGYGSIGIERKKMQKAQDLNAESEGLANMAQRTIAKTKSIYNNSHWDLIDAVEEDEEILKNDKALPPELSSLSQNDRIEFVTKKKAERKQIQKEISELAEKRDAFLANNHKEHKNTLDNVLQQSIRSHATKKGYRLK